MGCTPQQIKLVRQNWQAPHLLPHMSQSTPEHAHFGPQLSPSAHLCLIKEIDHLAMARDQTFGQQFVCCIYSSLLFLLAPTHHNRVVARGVSRHPALFNQGPMHFNFSNTHVRMHKHTVTHKHTHTCIPTTHPHIHPYPRTPHRGLSTQQWSLGEVRELSERRRKLAMYALRSPFYNSFIKWVCLRVTSFSYQCR
jgi:hypothetical protein